MTVVIDGISLTIKDVVKVARHDEPVELAEAALDGILSSRDVIEKAVKEGRIVYGVNTGFGDLSNVCIDSKDLAKLQVNLIRSHCAGVGPPFSTAVVRGMMLLRANALAKGFSGVRLDVIEMLVDMLNAGVTPIVPQQGSVGSSGDLAPLAHLCLTNNSYAEIIEHLLSFNRPIVATGGGGYNVENTVRAWALAWSVFTGAESEHDIHHGVGGIMLESTDWQGGFRDRAFAVSQTQREMVVPVIERTIEAVKKNIFPIHDL